MTVCPFICIRDRVGLHDAGLLCACLTRTHTTRAGLVHRNGERKGNCMEYQETIVMMRDGIRRRRQCQALFTLYYRCHCCRRHQRTVASMASQSCLVRSIRGASAGANSRVQGFQRTFLCSCLSACGRVTGLPAGGD